MPRQETLPTDIATVLDLQSSSGQWRLCRRLYCALGHTSSTIPIAPDGVKDWRWATALAVIFLRRHPDVIDETYEAYSRAIAWVSEPLLAEAHKRLPPADLYYPVDEQASRQGRWLEHAEEALEQCGYAYFIREITERDVEVDGDDIPDIARTQAGLNTSSNSLADRSNNRNNNNNENPATAEVARIGSHSATSARVGRSRTGRPQTSAAWGASSRRKAAAEREALEQSRGLRLELRRVIRAARTTFEKGDRVESRWRRPTRLDKPRVDHGAWHPGRLISMHKDGRVDMIFEDGEGERLSGIPAKHVRLAPCPDSSGRSSDDTPSSEVINPSCSANLSSASRRELAHIASSTGSLRCTWKDPVTFRQELDRLKKLGVENMRGRPKWRGSFPSVNFQATKALSIASGVVGATAQGFREARQRHEGRDAARRSRRRSRASLAMSTPDQTSATLTGEHRRRAIEVDRTAGRTNGISPCPALLEAQSKLVTAALAYNKCVAEARQCLARGAETFRAARTYSEQQTAFEETTAALGPAQPARAGYTDWRGRPVIGLQNATLDVVEAMDAWAVERAAAQEHGDDSDECRVDDTGGDDEGEVVLARKAPPFLWEGLPLVSTIIGHSQSLVAGAPELREWYGAGFPIERNPFFLAYPIDDRPVTPRNALVRAYVNGEMVTTVSPMLQKEREREVAALRAVLDRQAAAPSWWPATRGAMSEAHYQRIRRAEKVLLREERPQAGAGSIRNNPAT